MNVFGKFLSILGPRPEPDPEHAVLVHFDYGTTDLRPLLALASDLRNAILRDRTGEYDGHEVAVDGSDGYLYMYGPNAEALFATVRPILEATRFTQRATVTLRYGPPRDGVREHVVVLST